MAVSPAGQEPVRLQEAPPGQVCVCVAVVLFIVCLQELIFMARWGKCWCKVCELRVEDWGE